MEVEKAIVLLEDQMTFNRTMQRGWGSSMIETDAGNIVDGALYANQHKDVADALELAINALRAGGKDKDVPTMSAGQPLTLEQLQDRVWRPVWVEALELKCFSGWAIVNTGCFPVKGMLCYWEDYGKKWLAYAYPPAHIDRKAWTSEWINLMPALGAGDLETRCKSCGNLVLFETDFCPYCGKAMTEEAWEELEKRLMGVKNYGT